MATGVRHDLGDILYRRIPILERYLEVINKYAKRRDVAMEICCGHVEMVPFRRTG